MAQRAASSGDRRSAKHRSRSATATTSRSSSAHRGASSGRRTARAAAVDPRLDQRRRDVARSRRRKWWIGFGSLAGCVLLILGGWAILHSSLFSVRTVRVTGASAIAHDTVIAASGITSGRPLISIDTAAAATSVEAIPFVKSATVSLRWPSSVTIAVTMRTPVADVATGRKFARIDATGRVLARSANPPTKFTPIPLSMDVVGVSPRAPGSWLPSRAAPAVKVAAKVPPAFRGQVAKVVGNADGTVSLQMTSPVTINLGTADRLRAKFSDIAAIIAGTSLHAGDVIDVSVPQASTITRAAG